MEDTVLFKSPAPTEARDRSRVEISNENNSPCSQNVANSKCETFRIRNIAEHKGADDDIHGIRRLLESFPIRTDESCPVSHPFACNRNHFRRGIHTHQALRVLRREPFEPASRSATEIQNGTAGKIGNQDLQITLFQPKERILL